MPTNAAHMQLVEQEGGPDEAPAGKRTPGFGMIPAAVYSLDDAYALAVYAVLTKYANADGICWPTLATIKDRTNLSKPTILKAIEKLKKAQLVEVQHQERHGMRIENRYVLLAHRPDMEARRAAKLAAQATAASVVNVVD